MSLLQAIHFLQGSVATSDLVPSARLIHFTDVGCLSASDGITKASVPFKFDKKLKNKAVMGDTFIKAVKAAYTVTDAPTLTLTKNGSLCVASPLQKTFIPTADSEPTKSFEKESRLYDDLEGFLDVMKKLLPFVAVDGQQYWAGGVLFDKNHLFATDSKTLIQVRTKWSLENTFVLPFQGIKELLRLKINPETMQVDTCVDPKFVDFNTGASTLTVYPRDGNWPNISSMLNKVDYSSCARVNDSFFETVAKLKPFVGEYGTVYLKNGNWRTSLHSNTGSVVPCTLKYRRPKTELSYDGCYDINQLLNLRTVATKLDLSRWPGEVPFTGKNLRGIIAGRVQ